MIIQRKKLPKRKLAGRPFQKKYLIKEDKYKYEWVDGYVEKTQRTMDKNQSFLFDNLADLLDALKQKNTIKGRLISEVDVFFAGQHGRPDIAFFTKTQIAAARNNEDIVPEFVIEVISTTDQINRVHRKMEDYRKAKVKIVWQIFPELKQVHIYKGKKMQVCEEKDICSAEEVIKGFKISVNDLFK